MYVYTHIYIYNYMRYMGNNKMTINIYTSGTLMTSAAADVINHNGRKIGRFNPLRFCLVIMHISTRTFA